MKKEAAPISKPSNAKSGAGGEATSFGWRSRQLPRTRWSPLLRDRLELSDDDVYLSRDRWILRVLFPLTELPGFDVLRDPPLQPVDVLVDSEHDDLFSIFDEQDVLLHHPYDSYEPVIALLDQAADDPDVLAIKQTFYRTGVGSILLASLQRAAESSKQVTVLVELTARFDEERNIKWARALEEAGAHVIYGVRGYKTHAKICLIVKRTPHGLRRYVHLGTGNYNERTARVYTDFGLMTSPAAIAEDAVGIFQCADRLFGSAPAEEAGDGADRAAAAVPEADRSGKASSRSGPARGDHRENELAHRRRDHRRAV